MPEASHTYNAEAGREHPIVIYPGYHHRRIGCLGAGKGYVYVDAFGKIHPCPFCTSKLELDVLENPVNILLDYMVRENCHNN